MERQQPVLQAEFRCRCVVCKVSLVAVFSSHPTCCCGGTATWTKQSRVGETDGVVQQEGLGVVVGGGEVQLSEAIPPEVSRFWRHACNLRAAPRDSAAGFARMECGHLLRTGKKGPFGAQMCISDP